MIGSRLIAAALPLLAVVALACGDDGGGAPIDAGRNLDSSPPPCADAGDCAGEPFARSCIAGACAECADDADCAANPDALGPDCDTDDGVCICDGDADCEDNRNGPTCHELTRSCTCVADRDCPGRSCLLEPYLGAGVRTCQPR